MVAIVARMSVPQEVAAATKESDAAATLAAVAAEARRSAPTGDRAKTVANAVQSSTYPLRQAGNTGSSDATEQAAGDLIGDVRRIGEPVAENTAIQTVLSIARRAMSTAARSDNVPLDDGRAEAGPRRGRE